MRPHGSTTYPR